MKGEYGLFKRNNSKSWYFWYYEEHKRITKSTGNKLKHDAKDYVEEFLKNVSREEITFREYTKDFFTDKCLWTKKQKAYGKSLSDVVLESKRRILDIHLIPVFGNKLIHEIKKGEIENFLVSLDRATQTKNHILFTLRQILRQAEDDGYIKFSPAERVQSISIKHKKRGIFTLQELKAMFPSSENEMLKIWETIEFACLFLIFGCTGLRSGEMAALKWKDYLIEERALFIQRAVKGNKGDIGKTKTGESRIVLLSDKTVLYLDKWKNQTKYAESESLIFHGIKPDRPYDRRVFNVKLKNALKLAGVEKKDRVVHSFRHTFNTTFRNIMPDKILRHLTGHKTERMTRNYDNPNVEDLLKRIEPARKLIDGVF